jgi:hypothetical protein
MTSVIRRLRSNSPNGWLWYSVGSEAGRRVALCPSYVLEPLLAVAGEEDPTGCALAVRS